MGSKRRRAREKQAAAHPRDLAPETPPIHGLKREVAVAAGIFLLAAVVFTWPLGLHLTDSVPTGSAPPTVALFGLFTVEWTVQVVEHGRAYWDAPMFHPHRGTFAWSELQPFTALLVGALSKLTGTLPAYNLVLLGYLALTGLAGYALARQLTADRVAAIWAGLWCTAGAYPLQQLTILHLLAGAFPVACLAAILALAGRPRRWLACGAGAAFFLTLMTCGQFGLMLAVLLPVAVVPLVWGRRWNWRTVATTALPVAAGGLLALPLLLAQRAQLQRMGFERSVEDLQGAYTLADLFLPARGHWLAGRILHVSEGPDVYPFDLGLVAIVCLLAAGVVGGFRFWRTDPLAARRRVALSALSATALLLGFGPHLALTAGENRYGPFLWLRHVVPGLDAVRTPARFGMFATVGVAALAAAAFAFLRRRARERVRRRALTIVAFVLLLAEMWIVPIGLDEPDRDIEVHREVDEWLARNGEGEAVIELPMAEGRSEIALAREVRAMRRALRHGNPIVNGYSGYFPEPFLQIRDALSTDLAGRGRRYLDALGVRHVLVHDHDYPSPRAQAIAAALGGSLVFENGRDSVIRLDGAGPVEIAHPPAQARFRRAPRREVALGVPMAPSGRARLVVPEPGQRLRVTWPEAPGGTGTGQLRLRGTALLDAGAPGVILRVIRPPSGSRPGEAVLISDTRLPTPTP